MDRPFPAVRCSGARARGFTLIEVLLAMLLLAMGLALAFAVVRSTQAVTARGEAMAAHSERMRAVEGFLRRRLAGALPMAQAAGDGRPPLRFVGEAERMRFVSDLPAYLGEGGPHVHELRVVGNAGQRRLLLELSLVQEDATASTASPSPSRPPELLADRLLGARFRYRGLDPQGRLYDWQPRWQWPDRMPLQVEVVVEPEGAPAWPPMVVSLPQGGSGAAP